MSIPVTCYGSFVVCGSVPVGTNTTDMTLDQNTDDGTCSVCSGEGNGYTHLINPKLPPALNLSSVPSGNLLLCKVDSGF